MAESSLDERVYELFLAASDHPPEEQARLLQAEEEPSVARAVAEMLAADAAGPSSFLTEAPSLPASSTWGHYDVLEAIGEGGMAQVFRGRHRAIGREVAIKVLDSTLSEDEGFVSRFLQEAALVNAIRHPNIIDVTDFIRLEEPRLVAYVMELLQGVSLSDAMRSREWSPSQVVNVAWQMLDALEAVHRAGVVHRDLKPDNVFVVGDLEGDLATVPSVKLLDFGVAKVEEPTAHRTATGAIVGTPAYMAPEQAAGETVGPSTDIYAWGLIVHEMLTGCCLFQGTPPEIFHQKLRPDPPPWKADVEAHLEPLLGLLRRCFARRPELRPTSPEAKTVLRRLGAATGVGTARAVVVSSVHGQPAGVIAQLEAAADTRRGSRFEVDLPEVFATAFEQASDAADFARDVHALTSLPGSAGPSTIGLWMGSVYGLEDGELSGPVVDGAIRLMRFAKSGQTLMPRSAADAARRIELRSGAPLNWVSHGLFRIRSWAEPIELYELHEEGSSPSPPPDGNEEVSPIELDDPISGWRPGPGLSVPHRPGWRLLRQLGEGGFGDVWLAENAEAGDHRVFKFFFGGEGRREAQREAQLVERLRSALGPRSDLLEVLGVQLMHAPYYLETQHIAGGDLKTWLMDQGGPSELAMSERLELVAKTADALAAAHSVGVLHRDIKPGNVLIQPAATGPRVVLGDFGVGGLLDETLEAEPGEAATLPRADPTGSVVGTVLYMAPERLAGRPASLQSDVYALGVLLYQLVLGDLGRPVSPDWGSDIEDPLLREDLGAVLAGQPSKRLTDAREVARRLRNLEARRIERAEAQRRAELVARARRFRRIAIPVGVGLALFGGTMTFQARRIAQEAERANLAAIEAQRNATTAARVSDFLVDLFRVANPSASDADEVTARDLLDRGAERIREDLGEEPTVRAELMETISRVYLNLGRYPPALELTRDALQIRRAVLPPEDPRVGDSLAAMGMVQRLTSHYADAEEAYEEALAIYRASHGKKHPATAEALSKLAQLSYLRGRPAQARAQYDEALAIRVGVLGPEDPLVAESLTHLGWLDTEERRLEQGEGRLRRALEIRRRSLGESHFLVAETLNNLGANLMEQERYAEAESVLTRGLEIRQRVLDPDHRRIGNSMLYLAQLHRSQGKAEKAVDILERAVEILQRGLGTGHLDVGNVQFQLGLAYQALGRWKESKEAYEASLEIYQTIFGPHHAVVGQTLNNIGSLLTENMKQPENGEAPLRRAVEVFSSESADPYWRALTRWSLANSLRDQGLFDEAARHFEEARVILVEFPDTLGADRPDVAELDADIARLRRLERRAKD